MKISWLYVVSLLATSPLCMRVNAHESARVEHAYGALDVDGDLPCKLRSFDLDDTTELVPPPATKAPSALTVYARQVGLALLMRYIAAKEFFFNSWSTLVGYLYARRKA